MNEQNFWSYKCVFALFLLSFLALSCQKESVEPGTATYKNGVFITNEGPFQTGTGSISYYDRESGKVTNNIFQKENAGQVLGNIVHSITVAGDKAYIVVNNAQKIEIVEAGTFRSIATITGLDQPRYLLPINDDKAYISQYGADGKTGEIKIVDLNSNTITGTISVGTGPERMLKTGNKVYLSNGGFCSVDRRVSIINSDTDEVLDHIEVGDNPVALQIDKNGSIWVLTKGGFDCVDFSTTPSTLARISNDRVMDSFELPNGAANLSINKAKDKLFYTVGGSVYKHDIDATSINSSAIISKFFYALNIDPVTDLLFCADAKDFQSNGEVMLYSASGSLMDSLGVGIIPGGFWFQ